MHISQIHCSKILLKVQFRFSLNSSVRVIRAKWCHVKSRICIKLHLWESTTAYKHWLQNYNSQPPHSVSYSKSPDQHKPWLNYHSPISTYALCEVSAPLCVFAADKPSQNSYPWFCSGLFSLFLWFLFWPFFISWITWPWPTLSHVFCANLNNALPATATTFAAWQMAPRSENRPVH